jgi:tetratricopeptide (TPR) repeat protein
MESPRLARSLIYALFAVCPLLFFTDLTRNPFYTQIALLNVLVCTIWIVWLGVALKKGEFVWVKTPLDVPLLLLIGACLLSWAASFIRHPRLATPIYSEGSRAAVFLVVNTFLVYAAAVRSQTPQFMNRLLLVIYLASLVASVYGIAQYFGQEWIWPQSLNPYGSRPVSTFGNPNFLSSFLVLVLPVVFADMVYGVTPMPRPLLAIVFFSGCGALTATLTRSSWVGLVLGLAVVGVFGLRTAWQKPSMKRWILIGGVGLALLMLFWPKGSGNAYSATVAERLGEVAAIRKGAYAPVSQRFLIWISAWTMVKEHPILGKGWGTFELFYPFYQGIYLLEPAYRMMRTHANNTHNEILEYWSQSGLVGLALMFFVWVVFFRSGWSVTRRLPEDRAALVWGFMGGVAGMLADNLLNVSAHFAVPAMLLWWWVGSVYAADPASAARVIRIDLKGLGSKAAMAAAIVVLAGFSARAFCMWRAEIHFFEGFKRAKAGYDLPAAQKALETAYWWHHLEVNNNYELANVYARTSQPDKALYMYGRALDANAGYDEIYFNRATVLMQAGRTQDAIDNYKLALNINPLSREAYNALGNLYFKDLRANLNELKALYLRATNAFPDDRDLWNNLGYVYSQEEKWPEAFEAYRSALQADPDFDLGWKNLRSIAVHLPDRANDPILKQPELFQQVDALMAKKDWEGALNKLKPLGEAMPRSFRVRFYRGNIFFSMERIEEAVKEYQEAARLKPDLAANWQNLAVALDRLGRRQQARIAYEKLLTLDPNNAAVKQRLAVQ